ncbi:polyketide synthase [Fusarium acutatum]|uniref:Polyketide synthase n=1 Tax=Fusarium acutatum TaxID=78861 RepID=A0A8H4NHM1_9HYPO|nr:polyketide synthase [Fusarium acutatum]
MPGITPGLLVLEEANPTVRLKGKEGEYTETLEYDTFQSRGGNPEDLMDEERWLDFPAHVRSPLKQSKMYESERDTSLPPTGTSGMRIIWNPEPVSGLVNNRISKVDIGRKVTETHLVVKLAARACHFTSILKYEIKEWSGIAIGTQLSTDKEINGVFVEVSATNFRAIFMMKSSTQHLPDGFHGVSRQQRIENSLNLDNTELFELVFCPGCHIYGHEIIWIENMLIPGNISYVKRALHGRLDDGEKTRFLQLLKRKHHLLIAGNHPAGVAKTLPSNEELGRKPLLCRAIQGGKYYNNLHFTLKWPPMALLDLPEDMINKMQTMAYWNTATTEIFKAITGPARTIGPVFPDIGSDYYNTEIIASCARRWSGYETYYTQNLQFCLDNPELERKNMATRADELIRISDCLGIPLTERRTSHKTMLLEWDGMEEHLKSLGQEGKLKRLAAPEYSTPPAKRAQPVEPTLGSEIKAEIL